ncbi:MAG: nucleotidyl transferase AbiEii/AbiGii toxin family protein [Candidatus Njordarchaeales archaeon]
MIWEEITAKSEKLGMTVNQVFQDEIQKTVLTSLSHSEVFNHIVFQGGTALRVFYGSPRFSEDLDLVTRQNKMFDITKKPL